jgi:hypothetical protein
MGTIVPPSLGLGSNYNYFFGNTGNDNNGAPITGLTVVIQITESVEAVIGFDFQLNAYSPEGESSNWQQYVMCFNTTDPSPGNPNGPPVTYIGASVEYFGTTGFNTPVREIFPLQPSNTQVLPAGYVLTITLTSDPSNGNITAATFSATNGGSVLSWSVDIEGQYPQSLTPVYAYQLNVVGRNNAVCTYLAGGEGLITYTASCPITVTTGQPPYTEQQGEFTAEESNSVYSQLTFGSLPQPSLNPIGQWFSGNITTEIYRPGGYFAVSQQVGMGNQTNLYAVSQTGQLTVFSVQDSGHWEITAQLGKICMAHPRTMPAASQHFGANQQTNVFVVDQSGQLNTFWTEGTGGWNGPVPIGPPGSAPSRACLAASQQFGAYEQTDVFLVDSKGRLNVFFVQNANPWIADPVYIGVLNNTSNGTTGNYPESAPIAVSAQFGVQDQTDVFLVDNNGKLNVLWVVGGAPWSPQPLVIGPTVTFPLNTHVAASARFGVPNQTDVYAIDQTGTLMVFSVQDSGSWSDGTAISAGLDLHPGGTVAVSQRFGVPNQTDVFVVDENAQIYMVSAQGTGSWSAPEAIGPQGIAPLTDQAPQGNHGAFILASPQFGVSNQTDLFVMNQNGANGPGWPTVFWANGDSGWAGPQALVTEV